MSYADQHRIVGFSAASAGTRAVVSHPIHPEAASVLEQLGGTSTGFSARRLTLAIASSSDLILTMTKEHRDLVLEVAPRKLRSTYTLSEAALLIERYRPETLADLAGLRPHLPAEDMRDILDPIGQEHAFFRQIGAEIAELLPPVLELCRQP